MHAAWGVGAVRYSSSHLSARGSHALCPVDAAWRRPDRYVEACNPLLPQMDLLQLGPRGDLVVGSAELLVASLVNKGTVVHWFDLKAFNQAAGAQLCCVLRYLSGVQTKWAKRAQVLQAG